MQTKNKIVLAATAAFILIGAPFAYGTSATTETAVPTTTAPAPQPEAEPTQTPTAEPTPEALVTPDLFGISLDVVRGALKDLGTEVTVTNASDVEGIAEADLWVCSQAPTEGAPLGDTVSVFVRDNEACEVSTEPAEPEAQKLKWGKKGTFLQGDIPVTIKVEKPKKADNMFDEDNIDVRITFCNVGDESVTGLSAENFGNNGMYAVDPDGGYYDLYSAYRKPEFPVYSYQSKALKPGKCRKGWIGFDGANVKGIQIGFDIGDDDAPQMWGK